MSAEPLSPSNPPPDVARLERALADVTALRDIAAAMTSSLSVEAITTIAIDRSMQRVGTSQGAVFLLTDEFAGDVRARTFVRRIDPGSGELPFSLNMELLGWMLKHKARLVSNQPGSDPRFKAVPFGKLGIQSLLAVPLSAQRGLIGAMVLFNRHVGSFTDDDAAFLEIVALQTGKIIENFEINQKELALRRDLKLAQEIQQRFLPKESFQTDWVDLCAWNQPAKEVGGDFFDHIRLGADKLFIAIGDVAGKGMPAALVMSNAQAVVRSHLYGSQVPDLSELVGRLNQLLYDQTSPGQYVTAFYAMIDRSGLMQYVNAGHLPPLVMGENSLRLIGEDSDPVVGVVPDHVFRTGETMLQRGDRLLLMTDGITECFGPSGEMYGEERLQEYCRSAADQSSQQFAQGLRDAISGFRGHAEQSDDITYLTVKFDKPS